MTAKTFRRKFPDAPANSNCLHDVACHGCGSRGPFRVEVTTITTMHDDGTDGHEDSEPTGRYTQCRECLHEGSDDKFRIKGLDS
jgi:hypothetical protein